MFSCGSAGFARASGTWKGFREIRSKRRKKAQKGSSALEEAVRACFGAACAFEKAVRVCCSRSQFEKAGLG